MGQQSFQELSQGNANQATTPSSLSNPGLDPIDVEEAWKIIQRLASTMPATSTPASTKATKTSEVVEISAQLSDQTIDREAVTALKDIFARFQADGFTTRKLLLTGSEKPAFLEAAKELTSMCRVNQRWTMPDECPHCNKALIRKHGLDHMLSCELKTPSANVKKAIFDHVKGKPCPISGCPAKLSENSLVAIENHIRVTPDEKSSVCGFECSDGSKCTVPLLSVDVSTMGNALLRVHRQVEHGWHISFAHLVKRFDIKDTLLIGAKNIELRAEEALSKRTSKSNIDVRHHCGLCLNDTSLSPSERLHRYPTARQVAAHVLFAHVFPLRVVHVKCLHCSTGVAVTDFVEHLSNHGYKFAVGDKLAKDHKDFDYKGITNLKKPMEPWLEYLSTLDEATTAPLPEITNVASSSRAFRRRLIDSQAYSVGL